MTSYMDRLVQAAKLKPELYEEVEADKGAFRQAMGAVMLSSLAAGIGGLAKGGVAGILGGLIVALAGWFIWAYLVYLIGAKLLAQKQTSTDMGEMLRTIGFSSSPGLIRIFGIIPGLTGIVFILSSVWMFAAMVVAVRQALDYTSTMRAVGVCLIGWLIQVLFIGAFLFMIGGRHAM